MTVVAEAPVVDVQNARVGQAAVEQAIATAIQRDARTLSEVAAAQGRILVDGMVINRDGTRIVAGRSFRLDSGVWTDLGHTPKATVVDLEPFSPAYFDVLAKLPELTPYWSAFESVVVAGRQVSIRLASGGRSTLTAQEVVAVARDFRTQP